MVIKYFLSGLFVKLLAGFDDTMARISIMTHMTTTKKGRYAFATGILIAIALMTLVAYLFASLIREIPYSNYVAAGLIFLLAMSIQFDLISQKPKKKIREKLHAKRISVEKFIKLAFFGFITAFITIIDDTVAYSGVFLNSLGNPLPVIAGIFLGTLIQLYVIIYLSGRFARLKYKKEITIFGLVLLSLLLALKVL